MKLLTLLKLLKAIIIIGRFDAMYKQTMNAAKGIGMGILAGAAVAAVSTKVLSGSHKKAGNMKKSAGKAIHTVGNLITDVEKMLR